MKTMTSSSHLRPPTRTIDAKKRTAITAARFVTFTRYFSIEPDEPDDAPELAELLMSPLLQAAIHSF